MKRTVYQTVEARGSADFILSNAPFWCQEQPGQIKEWLGSGYYVWETFEELPHWWGRVRYRYNNRDYVICRTEFSCDDESILDLVSNTEQMLSIIKLVDFLRSSGVIDSEKISAQYVINLIRKHRPRLYKAIRAYGIDSSKAPEINRHTYHFSRSATLHLCPEIQICVIDKSTLKTPVEIVYCSDPIFR